MHCLNRPSIILTAPLTGAAYSASRYHALPLSPEAVGREALAAFREGARAIHYHARNPITAMQYSDLLHYKNVREILGRDLPGVPVSFASSRAGEVERDVDAELRRIESTAPNGGDTLEKVVQAELIRANGIEASPDRFTTFTPTEILMQGQIPEAEYAVAVEKYSELTRRAWKNPNAMRLYYRKLRQRATALGVGAEMEITTWKAFDVIEGISADPSLGLPSHVTFVLLFGFSAHLPVKKQVYDEAVARALQIGRAAGVVVHLTVGAAIHPNFAHPGPVRSAGQLLPPGKHDVREVVEWVAADPRIESFRAGLEDHPEMYGAKPTNAQLVAHARGIFESLGVEVELDVARVRQIFGLPSCSFLQNAA